jgi:hypothetical protein
VEHEATVGVRDRSGHELAVDADGFDARVRDREPRCTVQQYARSNGLRSRPMNGGRLSLGSLCPRYNWFGSHHFFLRRWQSTPRAWFTNQPKAREGSLGAPINSFCLRESVLQLSSFWLDDVGSPSLWNYPSLASDGE